LGAQVRDAFVAPTVEPSDQQDGTAVDDRRLRPSPSERPGPCREEFGHFVGGTCFTLKNRARFAKEPFELDQLWNLASLSEEPVTGREAKRALSRDVARAKQEVNIGWGWRRVSFSLPGLPASHQVAAHASGELSSNAPGGLCDLRARVGRGATKPPWGSRGAVHAVRFGWQCVEAFDCDLEPADRARSVPSFVEASLGGGDVGKRVSSFLEERCDLLALPGNGVAFGVVFVIGSVIARCLNDAVEAAQKTRGALNGRSTQFVESGAGIVRSGVRGHWALRLRVLDQV